MAQRRFTAGQRSCARLGASAAALCALLCMSSTLNAETTGPESLYSMSLEQLGRVQVQSASKQLEPSILAPGTVYVIRRDEIERHGFRTLQDALKIVPSVYLYDPHSWVWGGQRGLVSNFSQTLVLVNGREVNNLIALEGFISRQFATHNVERIEIVAGPSSALYGANALAGVINIISRELDPAYDGYEIEAEVGSYERRAGALTFGKRISDQARVSGSVRYFQSDEADYTDFVADQERFLRGWEDAAIAAPFIDEYRNPSQAATWEAQLDYGDFYAGTFGYYNRQSQGLEKPTWNFTDNEDHRRFELYYAGADREFSDRWKVKAEYQFIRSFLWGKYFQGLWPVARLEAPDGVDLFAFPAQVTTSTGVLLNGQDEYMAFYPSFAHYLIDQNVIDPANVGDSEIRRYFTHLYSNKESDGSHRHRVDLQVDWAPDDVSSVIAGASLDFIDYAGLAVTDGATGIGASSGIDVDSSKRLDVYDSEKYGAFVQYKRELEAWNLWLTAGLRYDHQNHYGGTLNPRASLVWQPVEGTVLEAAYSEAFREPNVFELASDPGLDPAKMRAWELSLNQLIADYATLQLVYYHNRVTDFLGSVSSLIGTGVSSVDSQTIQGLEFQLEGRVSRWRWLFNGAHIFDAEQDVSTGAGVSSTQDVLGIPETRLNAGVTGTFGGWDASLLFRYQRHYEAFSGSPNLAEPITIRSTKELNFAIDSPEVDLLGGSWRASMLINNLLDRRNVDANIRRSGTHQFLQDGRSFVFSLNGNF
jgi:outer membrane receptor protein involved in Fe transport